ncbi:MAG: tetratricopeptide repeat protein, partial [Mangrovibacterium sp.]
MKLKGILAGAILMFALGSTVLAQSTVSGESKTKKIKIAAISETPLSQEAKSEFEYIFIEALNQKQLGNFDAAQQLLARCLEIDPLSAVSMYEMGRLHYNKKDLTSAALLFTKAVDVNPQNKWYKLTLADVFQQIGKYDLAAALYE